MTSRNKLLTDVLTAHGDNDWYVALLRASLDVVEDFEMAVDVANRAFSQYPEQPARSKITLSVSKNRDDEDDVGDDDEDESDTIPAFLYGQSEGAGPITTTATDTASEPRERKSFHRKKLRNKRSHKRGRRKGRRVTGILRGMRVKKKWIPSASEAPLALETGQTIRTE